MSNEAKDNMAQQEYWFDLIMRTSVMLIGAGIISMILGVVICRSIASVFDLTIDTVLFVVVCFFINCLISAWMTATIVRRHLGNKIRNIFPRTQEGVDTRLAVLADMLQNVYENETLLLQECLTLPEDHPRQEFLRNYARTKAERKKEFWDTHAFASSLGYEVRKSYKDYLPPPTRSAKAA